jgi:hypothetical protein
MQTILYVYERREMLMETYKKQDADVIIRLLEEEEIIKLQ